MAKSLARHTQTPDKASGSNTQNYMCQVTKILGRFMRVPLSQATRLSHGQDKWQSPLYDIRNNPIRHTQNYMCQLTKILGRFMRMPLSQATWLSHVQDKW